MGYWVIVLQLLIQRSLVIVQASIFYILYFWPFCCDLQVRTARERRRRGGGVQESRVSVKVEAEGGE